jgi:hypothetical protein
MIRLYKVPKEEVEGIIIELDIVGLVGRKICDDGVYVRYYTGEKGLLDKIMMPHQTIEDLGEITEDRLIELRNSTYSR